MADDLIMLNIIVTIILSLLVLIQYYLWHKFTQPRVFLYSKRATNTDIGYFQISVKNICTIPVRLLAITTKGTDWAPQVLHDSGLITNDKLRLIDGLSYNDTIRQMKAVNINQYIIQPGDELHLLRVTDENDAKLIRQYLLDVTPHILIHYQSISSILPPHPYMWSTNFNPHSWRTTIIRNINGQHYAQTTLVEPTKC